MKVLSLFDGMACGMMAMQGAGVLVERYVAYEIDKYAVQTSTHNFPMIEHRGDVFKADFTEFEGFDFLVGGSPCTYWSIAQKNNRETEASGMGWELFSQYVRALHEAKPRFFVYENNKSMSKAIRASIDEAFGFEAVCINSALVSAQNRQRLYWVGKRNEDGTYSKVDIEQPEDRGILLKDVLDRAGAKELTEREVDYMFRVPERTDYGYIQKSTEDKSKCITANIAKGVPYNTLFENVTEPIRVGALPRPNGELSTSQAFRVYSVDGKSVNITAGGGGAGGKTGLYAVPTHYATPCEWDESGKPIKAISVADGKTYTVYEVKDGKITIKGKQYAIKLADGFYIIRKLTVRECMRLQTVPEWYAFPVSDSQAYKMLGNGWTVEVIKHLVQSALADDGDDWML